MKSNKGFFQEQRIFHYEWKDKTLLNSEINQWKNWLRSHSQYNLPRIAWARLVTQKWKKKINQDSLVLNPSLNKGKFGIENIWIGEFSTFGLEKKVIPIKLLLFNFNETKNVNKQITLKKKGFIPSNEKKFLRFFNLKKEENESAGQEEFESDKETKINTESALSKQEKKIEENYTKSKIKKRKNKKTPKSNTEAELDLFLKRYSRFQLRWNCFFNQKILNNVKAYCLLVRLKNPTEITISCIERGEMSLDILMIEKNFTFSKLMKKGILIVEPVRLSVKNDGQLIIYLIQIFKTVVKF
ncbi:hypothetical protein HID58_076573 [Brassica napus]|uniref:Uncharacterized protein n=1 Tax=Brassica napus TaxID=3708 RepID=A0ABQ7YN26_BRANA|nr:hypothetical protein HID58_076573 [Brassica napus]